MKVRLSAACALALFILTAQGLSAQEKFALVIGNGNYTGQGLTPLANPGNDAQDVAEVLRELGFTVDVALDASQARMDEAVSLLKSRLSGNRNSYGFFFYAGHGVQSQGENYLIPADANIPGESHLRSRAVAVQALLDELNEAGNELNVVVLDACRDNPFGWNRSGSRGLSVASFQPADSIIVYATSAGKSAADGEGRNGLFTGQLLKNLRDTRLEVKEIFNRTGADVSAASGRVQIPAVYNQFFGTAYLGPRPQASIVQAPPAQTPSAQATAARQPAPEQPAAIRSVPVTAPIERPAPANMVRIAGGTFTMGSPANEPERDRGELPHQVTVGGFYIGKHEVTQKDWQAVMGTNPSRFKGDNLPVENVSWYEAIEYCNKLSEREGLSPAYTIDKSQRDPNNKTSGDHIRWLVTWNRNADGYRLPTEAEWEYACRAGTATPFSTGNNISTNDANYNGNGPYNNNVKGMYRLTTVNVGSFEPNPWGLYDMHGNVYEWCWDWRGNYAGGAQTDPSGIASGAYRVGRGGSWNNHGRILRSAARDSLSPWNRNSYFGFRIARP